MNDPAGAHPSALPRASRSAVRHHSEIVLLVIFFLSLPLMNPWIRGDGVGYYAFARAPLIEHALNFTNDYLHANPSFRDPRVGEDGQPRKEFVTRTGHLDNHFTIGPALLWMPFLLVAHGGVLLARALGSPVAADGFSAPYRIAMAFGTVCYAFAGLLISFRLARHYVEERWALLGTIGIWWASSLPVYMYFNPSWSHAHSAFSVALFFWYWHETRLERALRQWILLGLIAGLMITVYYANAMVLVAPGVEALSQYAGQLVSSQREWRKIGRLFVGQVLFLAAIGVCMLPTLLTRYVIYGSAFESGYVPLKDWLWRRPASWYVLFSPDHGLFTWTPALLLAFLGLVYFAWRQPRVGVPWLAAALAFFGLISCYPNWDGLSSYGNRFFVSLTILFVIGFAVMLEALAGAAHNARIAERIATAALLLLIAWNIGFMYQWGTHLVPARGPITWREMIHNQVAVVPKQMAANLRDYFTRRKSMMQELEQKDIEQRRELKQP